MQTVHELINKGTIHRKLVPISCTLLLHIGWRNASQRGALNANTYSRKL